VRFITIIAGDIYFFSESLASYSKAKLNHCQHTLYPILVRSNMGDYSLNDLERDYYLGSYQTCINKANLMPASPDSIYYLCLSYRSLRKQDNFEREVEKSASKYLSDDSNHEWKFLTVFMGELDGTLDLDAMNVQRDDERTRLLMSAIYSSHSNFEQALRVLDHFDTLRSSHAKITTYIMMHRLDLAEKQLVKMQKEDEQNPISELTSAMVYLANNNPTQAWRLALSLAERFKPTPLLTNLQTAAALALSDYDSAKQLCESSLDMDNDNVEALINMIHIQSKSRSTTQAALIERNLERLRDLNPEHNFLKDLDSIQSVCT
jgi:tetratricopeptide (TPR) repeat protein